MTVRRPAAIARVAAALALLALVGCGETDPFGSSKPEMARPIRYEVVSPAPGTTLRRGDRVELRVHVIDGPQPLGAHLGVGVDYVEPGGRESNTFLVGVDEDYGATPFPITLSVRFVVPEGIPDNGFIPPGSRVTAVRANLYCTVDVHSVGPGTVATYPIVD